MKTYLITGGSGFIGSHLVESLLKTKNNIINIDNFHDFYNYKIKVRNTIESTGNKLNFSYTNNKQQDIYKLKDSINNESYKLYISDIRNLEEVDEIFSSHKIDCVIHLAALAGVRPSIENPIDYQDVNINGTMNLWEACKKHNVKKFICASSSSVYGNNEKTPFSETDNVDNPISPYAATKKSGEIIGHVYHKLYNIDMIQLRFFTVYGPRQRPDLAIHKFAKLIDQNEPIPFYGDGLTARDYTFIDDIIDGILKSIKFVEKNTNVYEVLNLGESEVITLNQMVKTLEDSLNKKAIINKLPMQPGDVQKTNADISKAKNLIGYLPKTNFKQGIDIFVNWLKNS